MNFIKMDHRLGWLTQWVVLFVVLLAATSCKETRYMTAADAAIIDNQLPVSRCNNIKAYEPDTAQPIKYVRVNFHIMQDDNGLNNFEEVEGRAYIHQYMNVVNDKLANNQKMYLPKGNNTPVLPTNYRFVLAPDPSIPGDDGIYFHQDEELYYFLVRGKKRHQASKFIFNKYGIQKGKVLNIFIQPHHPDSLQSKTYNPTITGIAFPSSNWLRIAGLKNYSRDTLGTDKNGRVITKGPWFCAGLMNHEAGHVLGIHHTWGSNDGCDDTPRHPNCFAIRNDAPCNERASNNVMDYNTYQNAWSPCQLGKVHRNFASKSSSQRKILVKTWCELRPDAAISIRDSVVWNGARDLEGHLTIKNGGVLTINCRVSLPENAQITIEPRGTLVLNGATLESDCGGKWAGIRIQQNGKRKGRVILMNNPTIKDNLNGYQTTQQP